MVLCIFVCVVFCFWFLRMKHLWLRYESTRKNKRYRLSEDDFAKIQKFDEIQNELERLKATNPDVILADQRKQEFDRMQQGIEKLQDQICTLTGKLESVSAELETYKKENFDMSCVLSAHVAAPHMLPFSCFIKVKQEQHWRRWRSLASLAKWFASEDYGNPCAGAWCPLWNF